MANTGGPGLFIPPLSGGAVSIAVQLIRAFEFLRIPVAIYQTSRALEVHAKGDWGRLHAVRGIVREEIVDAVRQLRPAWILALDSDPLDEILIRSVRTVDARIPIGIWFVEDPETEAGSWGTHIAPLVDAFFSMEGGEFAAQGKAKGWPMRWLPAACDDRVFSPPPAGAERRGVSFLGVPRPWRVDLFTEWTKQTLPLSLHGPGWIDIPTLAPLVETDGWTDDESTARIFRSSLIVLDLYDGRGGRYVNPRTLNAMATGALVLSEPRADLNVMFGEGLTETCRTEEMGGRIRRLLEDTESIKSRGMSAAKEVLSKHTFAHRAADIVQTLKTGDRVDLPV